MRELSTVALPEDYINIANYFGAQPMENRSICPNTGAVSFVVGYSAVHLIPTTEDGREFVAIDGGTETGGETASALLSEWDRAIGNITALYITHSHPDHLGLATPMHALDVPIFASSEGTDQLKQFGAKAIDPEVSTPHGLIEVRTVPMPGHTKDSIAYLVVTAFGQTLFSGDSLDMGIDQEVKLPPKSFGDIILTENMDEARESIIALRAVVGKIEGLIIRPSHSAAMSGAKFMASTESWA